MTFKELQHEARMYLQLLSLRGAGVCDKFSAKPDMNGYCANCEYSHVSHVYKQIVFVEK